MNDQIDLKRPMPEDEMHRRLKAMIDRRRAGDTSRDDVLELASILFKQIDQVLD